MLMDGVEAGNMRGVDFGIVGGTPFHLPFDLARCGRRYKANFVPFLLLLYCAV
jgi:hypothetical protein